MLHHLGLYTASFKPQRLVLGQILCFLAKYFSAKYEFERHKAS